MRTPVLALRRDLTRHPWQAALAALGVALGVSIAVAVDVANGSALRAFQVSLERVAGPATHRIESASGQISDADLALLTPALAGLDASPALESRVRISGAAFALLGIDPLSFAWAGEGPGRDPGPSVPIAEAIGELIAEPGTVLLGTQDARRIGVPQGGTVGLDAGSGEVRVRVLKPLGPGQDERLQGLAIADIATAQELSLRLGWIDRVDLALSDAQARSLAPRLSSGLRLVQAGQRAAAFEDMTRAFRLNLSAMSLLGILVGAFLVYNAMTFAVLRRRPLLATLRTLGVTRGGVFALVMGEAAALALLGSLAGLALGVLAGWGLVQLVVRTIDDLYFPLEVAALQVAPGTLAAGLALGLGCTLVAALGPALEAARSEPRDLLRPGEPERRARPWVLVLAGAGLALLGLGLALAQVPSESLGLGFLALLLAVLGFALVVPALLLALTRALGALASPLMPWAAGRAVSMGARGIAASIARSGIAAAALTVAVSATVGVGIMIESFRGSLSTWLETTLQSDLYVSAGEDGQLPQALPARIAAVPGVAEMSLGRRVRVESDDGPVWLLALGPSSRSPSGYRLQGTPVPDLWGRFRRGELVLASEPLAYRRRLAPGQRIELFTVEGLRSFEIGAVFRDYGSDSGMLVMEQGTYARLWDDPGVSTLGLVLAPDLTESRSAETRSRVREIADSAQSPALVSANREIRERSLAIFDRTFAVTQVLRLLALGVAFVGVLGALMAQQLESRREHAIVRATGMTRGALAGLILVETSILGLSAGLCALPLGVAMGELLIRVINLRSFGWTMEMQVPIVTLLCALALAWGAALLAGLYPAWSAARAAPAAALRGE